LSYKNEKEDLNFGDLIGHRFTQLQFQNWRQQIMLLQFVLGRAAKKKLFKNMLMIIL